MLLGAQPGRIVQAESVGASAVNVYAVLINGTVSGVLSVNPQEAAMPYFLMGCVVGKIAAVPGVESTCRTIKQRLKTRTYLSSAKPLIERKVRAGMITLN